MSEKTVDPFEMPPDPNATALDREVIGMEKLAAVTKIQDAGCRARITSEDGEPFIVTMDYHSDRLNLDIVQGKVVGVHRG